MANYSTRPAIDRFMEKVIPVTETGCWLWLGAADKRGYGVFYFNGKVDKAHRVSLALHGRAAASNEYACHRCDTPMCVNPDHLFAGTPKDNQDDMRAKGRAGYCGLKGIRNGRAKLTENDVRTILSSDEPTADIARRLHVTYQAIWQVRNGIHWKEVA